MYPPAIPVTDYAKKSKKQSLRKQKPTQRENPYEQCPPSGGGSIGDDLHEAKSLIDYINFDGRTWYSKSNPPRHGAAVKA